MITVTFKDYQLYLLHLADVFNQKDLRDETRYNWGFRVLLKGPRLAVPEFELMSFQLAGVQKT